jgi:hypothetical protein
MAGQPMKHALTLSADEHFLFRHQIASRMISNSLPRFDHRGRRRERLAIEPPANPVSLAATCDRQWNPDQIAPCRTRATWLQLFHGLWKKWAGQVPCVQPDATIEVVSSHGHDRHGRHPSRSSPCGERRVGEVRLFPSKPLCVDVWSVQPDDCNHPSSMGKRVCAAAW